VMRKLTTLVFSLFLLATPAGLPHRVRSTTRVRFSSRRGYVLTDLTRECDPGLSDAVIQQGASAASEPLTDAGAEAIRPPPFGRSAGPPNCLRRKPSQGSAPSPLLLSHLVRCRTGCASGNRAGRDDPKAIENFERGEEVIEG
jgi:hypothetical protein